MQPLTPSRPPPKRMARPLMFGLVAGAAALTLCCVVGVGALIIGGNGVEPTDHPGSSPTLNIAQPTSGNQAASCLVVSAGFLRALGISAKASAVEQPVTAKQTGLLRNGKLWFVSTMEGATWVTNADPTSADPGGLILPLNSEARAASDVGADAKPAAPIYEGLTDDADGAKESRQCARA